MLRERNKRKKRAQEKLVFAQKKWMDRDSLKNKLFLMNEMLRNEELDNSVLYLFICPN